MKSNLSNNYNSYFYLFIGTATTSWLGQSYEIFTKDVYDTSNYSQVNKKINKCFIGTYWSDGIKTDILLPYSGDIKIGSAYKIGDTQNYGVSAVTLQAGTTISLKAYQLNFS